RPIDTPGSRLIVNEARRASRAKPLIVVLGGQATTVAGAYLLDNSIADRLVVAWAVGRACGRTDDYNEWVDRWAGCIVLMRLRLVTFPFRGAGGTAPLTPRDRLHELPDTELRQHMLEKEHPNGNPGSWDGDSSPVVSLVRPDYVRALWPIAW